MLTAKFIFSFFASTFFLFTMLFRLILIMFLFKELSLSLLIFISGLSFSFMSFINRPFEKRYTLNSYATSLCMLFFCSFFNSFHSMTITPLFIGVEIFEKSLEDAQHFLVKIEVIHVGCCLQTCG